MQGLSHTLDIARRAMNAQQAVLTVVGHNIANANTPGYTRQISHLSAVQPSAYGGLSFGNGVVFDSILRKRDAALDSEIRNETSLFSRWETRTGELERLEQMLAEPSDAGLSAAMDSFFTAWADLAGDPSAATRRATVREQGRILAGRFGAMARQVDRMQSEIRSQLGMEVEQFNLTLSEIKTITSSIRASGLRGLGARDLEDRRDALLDELAKVAEISYGEKKDGDFYLRVDGKLLLDASTYRPLELVRTDTSETESTFSVRIGTGATVEIENGSLGALFELHDQTLPDFMSQVDTLAKTLIENINAVHRSGPSRADFFSGSDAASMALSNEVEESLNAINTSTSGLAGDNDIALALAQMRDAPILTDGTASPIEYWNSVVGRVGVVSREAQIQEETLSLTTRALEERREENGGVSLDEEMAQMIQTQQAYIAAVRLFEVAGDLMEVLTRR